MLSFLIFIVISLANGKLLAINKSLRKNNKSLALAYQEMKIQLRMKNDEILTLLDERMECQGKLLDVNYAAKSKVVALIILLCFVSLLFILL